MRRIAILLGVAFITAVVAHSLVWWSPQAWYWSRSGSVETSCSKLVVGMSQTDVLALMEHGGQPSVESTTENGFYFYRNGGCRVTIDPATGRVTKAEVDRSAVK